MANKDLGKKRRCASCGMKFYDFNKTKIECPSCQTLFNPDQLLKSRRGKSAKATPIEEDAAVELDKDAMLGEDDSDEDTDSLGGDEDLVNIPASESNDEEEGAAILDDNVDEDFIDEIDDEGEGGEPIEDEA